MIRSGTNIELPIQGKAGPSSLGHQPVGKRQAKEFTLALEENGRLVHEHQNGKELGRVQGTEAPKDASVGKGETTDTEASQDKQGQLELAPGVPQLIGSGAAGSMKDPDSADVAINWSNNPGLFTKPNAATGAALLADDRGPDTQFAGQAEKTNIMTEPEAANIKSTSFERLPHSQGLTGRAKPGNDLATDKQSPVPASSKATPSEAPKPPVSQTIMASGLFDQKAIGGSVPQLQTLGDSANPSVIAGSSPPGFTHALSSMVEAGLIGQKITSKLNSLHFHMTVPELGSFSVRIGGRDEVPSIALTPSGDEQSEEVMALQEEMNHWLAQTKPELAKSDVSMQAGQNAPTLPDQPQSKDRRDGASGLGHSGQKRQGENEGRNSGNSGNDRHQQNVAGEIFGKWRKI